MAPQSALPSGNRELLKHFKVLKFLGKGSFGSVYKVKRISDDKIYAVKEMDVKSMSQVEREEAVNEVRLLASVKHPNIVDYNEAFVDGNRLCIVMEYAAEGDFSSIVKKQQSLRKPFPETEIWNYFIQIARGIGALHGMKVLHRDIKPGNIMVAEGRRLTIGDLGIAKFLKSNMAKTQIGTPHYMPPEVWKSRPYAFPSDVWALGCMLYEMATFTVPFEARSMSELRYKILRGRFPPISRQYSSDLTGMVNKMLDQTPENRPTIKQILDMPFIKDMAQKLKMEAADMANNKMLNTIQVPRNLNQLKGKFPSPQYEPEKENMFHQGGGGLPAINEKPAAPARAPSAARSRSEPRERVPSAAPSRVPSRGGAFEANRRPPSNRYDVVPPSIQPPTPDGNGRRPGRRPSANIHQNYAHPPQHHNPHLYSATPSPSYAAQRQHYQARGNSRGSHVPQSPYFPPIPGVGAGVGARGPPGRVGAPPSQYEAQRNKAAQPPPARPPAVSRVGSRAESVYGAKGGQYGQPAPYPPPYMARQGSGAQYANYAQYHTPASRQPQQYPQPYQNPNYYNSYQQQRQPYHQQPPPYPMSRNPYAQPSAQRHRPIYHERPAFH